MTSNNPFGIDLNEAFSSAVKRREEAAKVAEQELLESAHALVGDIAFKVHEALNSDDPLGNLQAIHDGAGSTKTVEVEVTDPKLVEELEELRKEKDELKTKVGRLEKELEEAKATTPEPPKPPTPAKKAAVSPARTPSPGVASQRATPRPTLWGRVMSYINEKKSEQGETTSTERSSS